MSGTIGAAVQDAERKDARPVIRTFGHGTLSAEEFSRTLHRAGVETVLDIRSYPGSRHNPQFGRQEMERWLPESGLGYLWLPALGGRRKPTAGSRHVALRNEAFRAYADYMETKDFAAGIKQLLSVAESTRCTVLCSETVWWRCHRRLLADHLVLVEQRVVLDLMHDGREAPHMLTPGVRIDDEVEGGGVVYDVIPASQLVGP